MVKTMVSFGTYFSVSASRIITFFVLKKTIILFLNVLISKDEIRFKEIRYFFSCKCV